MENQLHREILEEHARCPRLMGTIADPNKNGTWVSSKTGNSCTISMVIRNSRIQDIRFSGQGSALSEACASIMCSEIKGRNCEKVQELCQNLISYIEKNEEFPLPGELVIYETIIRFSERHDCSLLGWRALNVALVDSE